jgi:hypothetical protein
MAELRDATHWDEVVTALGYGYLRRRDPRLTDDYAAVPAS